MDIYTAKIFHYYHTYATQQLTSFIYKSMNDLLLQLLLSILLLKLLVFNLSKQNKLF